MIKDNETIQLEFEQRLYPVVLDLFSIKDFYSVTFKDLSKHSGLSILTIDKYFSSKEDLLFKVLDKKISEIISLIKIHTHGIDNTEELFRRSFWLTMEYCDRNPGIAIIFFVKIPQYIWMQSKTYERKEIYDLLSEMAKHGREHNQIDPKLKDYQIMNLFLMHFSFSVQTWYYKGRKWKLVDSIKDFFPLFWKAVS
ncbi:MAG: TetR/AcrR family transcriptional regulator [Desulfobacterales bacterium]|nr:TetR/AcrR family transcriptional regulator [Desulfobacterales bacterium]